MNYLLYIKSELSNIANENIFVSWFESSSKAPIPSVSITRIFMFSPFGYLP